MLKLQSNDNEREVRELKSQITEIETLKQNLQDKIKTLEQMKIKMIEEQDKKIKEVS